MRSWNCSIKMESQSALTVSLSSNREEKKYILGSSHS